MTWRALCTFMHVGSVVNAFVHLSVDWKWTHWWKNAISAVLLAMMTAEKAASNGLVWYGFFRLWSHLIPVGIENGSGDDVLQQQSALLEYGMLIVFTISICLNGREFLKATVFPPFGCCCAHQRDFLTWTCHLSYKVHVGCHIQRGITPVLWWWRNRLLCHLQMWLCVTTHSRHLFADPAECGLCR